MFTREKWQCFNALEHYLKQQGIDLDSVPDDELEMDESAKIYALGGAYIEGVEIDKGNVEYFVPLLEFNSDIIECLSELKARGYSYETITWKDKEYYILIEKENA